VDASSPHALFVPDTWRSPGRFVCAAFKHCTWRLAAIAALLGLTRTGVMIVALWVGGNEISADFLILRPLLGEVIAFCMLTSVLIAEQWVRVGARRLPAYAIAVFAGSIGAGALCATVGVSFYHFTVAHESTFSRPPMAASATPIGMCAYFFGDALSRGGMAAYIYAKREQMLGSIRALRGAEVERAQAEQRVSQMRLRALQAQVDPQRLLDRLARVEALYGEQPSEAHLLLDALIQELRAMNARRPMDPTQKALA
jgi:hypothetical protein